jgi:predicted MPP superfamily phosphohydrolase
MWQNLWVSAALISIVFLFADWMMLAQLPRQQRSWGPITPPLLGLTTVRGLLAIVAALISRAPTVLFAMAAIQAVISAMAIYATWLEPFQVGVTQLRYKFANWQGDKPLRVLHISDLHFEGYSPREQNILTYVKRLKPDLILLTGDYLNLSSVYDPEAQKGVRQFLKQLKAPLGVFAITGSPVVDMAGIIPEIFKGLKIRWLNDERITVQYRGNTLHLIGIQCTYTIERDLAALQQLHNDIPDTGLTILLYHTPDLMPSLAELDIDLYLCGHTHGGQIRLPVYGAIATSSRWGKRYEMGLYREGNTTLYVSRGLGLEGLGAPRARFLAPPEIILWDIITQS